MLLLQRLFRKTEADPRDALRPLYAQIVATARQPHWFVEGKVADTIEGRFEMVAIILSLVLLRLEGDTEQAGSTALLIELFVEDMDPQLREVGIGDMMVEEELRQALAEGAEAARGEPGLVEDCRQAYWPVGGSAWRQVGRVSRCAGRARKGPGLWRGAGSQSLRRDRAGASGLRPRS